MNLTKAAAQKLRREKEQARRRGVVTDNLTNVRAEVQRVIGKDLDGIKDTLKRVEAQNSALIIMLNNSTKATEKMSKAMVELVFSISTLLQQPKHHLEAINTIEEFLNHITSS